jgi:hypothetical protein
MNSFIGILPIVINHKKQNYEINLYASFGNAESTPNPLAFI